MSALSQWMTTKVSDYDQDIPQSHTTDQPTAPGGNHRTITVPGHP